MPVARVLIVIVAAVASWVGSASAQNLDPRGKVHVPIGMADSNDRLKTFVEAEGNFSPGVGSYGVYFWATDPATGKLVAPTTDGVKVEHGLAPGGALIPWAKWSAGSVEVRTEVCHTVQPSPAGDAHVAAARAQLTNRGEGPATFSFYVAVRPVGPAGFDIGQVGTGRQGLLVNSLPAVVAVQEADAAAASADGTIGQLLSAKPETSDQAVTSPTGHAAAALRYNVTLKPGQAVALPFVFPVLPGRRVLPHRWDGVSTWAQFDLAPYNPGDAGEPQPRPELEFYRGLNVDKLFEQAAFDARDLAGVATIKLPDARWADALAAITQHVAVAMNDGAPDVAVVNYNVFNRDGVYVTNILQKTGRADLAARCIDYFLSHPFNGRVEPEADNPGQILWVIGEHWRFTRDKDWLARIYPGVQKLAAMIRYYRTAPEPHWVSDTSLEFGDALPEGRRKLLKPGACDGVHPEYTQAWDVSGLRAAAMCAKELENGDDAASFGALADELFKAYDAQFGNQLPREYGSYSVLWPCRVYPFGEGKAFEQFKPVGGQEPTSWRYFPLAKSHQGLLAGNREAGWRTIGIHLDHEQMTGGQKWKEGEPTRGFFAFDEGGKSGAGGWTDKDGKPRLRTTWNSSVAMPHGWAVAELHLLIRDALAHEDGERLVLLSGVPAEWFKQEMSIENLPTHFGPLTLKVAPGDGGSKVSVSGAKPPAGFVVRTPSGDVTIAAEQTEAVIR